MKEDMLPQELADLVKQVVCKTHLWPWEKRDVRAELVSHFQDGLQELTEEGASESEAVAQLRSSFGDAGVAARLIRRGKQRNRSLVWKTFVAATRGLMILIALTIIYAGWLWFGKANPSFDYISKANEPIDAIPAEDRAWPILKEVYLEMNPMPEKVSDIDKSFPLLTPHDDGWQDAMAWVESNRHLIPRIYEAAAKRAYGNKYDNAESWEFMYEIRKRRGKLEKGERPPQKQDYEDDGQLIHVLLPSLSEARMVSKLLVLDARGHLAKGDFIAAWPSLEAAYHLGIQLLTTCESIIEQMVGMAINNLACEATRQALYEYQDRLTAKEFNHIRKSMAVIKRAGHIPLIYDLEEYSYQDIVQRVFTDDGDGDGVLIPTAFISFCIEGETRVIPAHKSDWEEMFEGLAVAAVHAGRKETLAKFAQLWEINKRLLSIPLYDPQWARINDTQRALSLHSELGYRFEVVRTFMPSIRRADLQSREARMNLGATLAVIALLHDRADHGRYPDSLDALVPDYLDQVPEDVFCAGGLKYKLGEDGRMLLYSVGHNLVDDNGSSEKLKMGRGFASTNDPADIIYWPPSEP